jgi:hypothetical protein
MSGTTPSDRSSAEISAAAAAAAVVLHSLGRQVFRNSYLNGINWRSLFACALVLVSLLFFY